MARAESRYSLVRKIVFACMTIRRDLTLPLNAVPVACNDQPSCANIVDPCDAFIQALSCIAQDIADGN